MAVAGIQDRIHFNVGRVFAGTLPAGVLLRPWGEVALSKEAEDT